MTDRDLLILAIRMMFLRRAFSLTTLTELVAQNQLLNRRWKLVYGTKAPHSLPGMTKAKLVADIRRASNNGAPERSTSGRTKRNSPKRVRQSPGTKLQRLRSAFSGVSLCQN